MKKIITLSVFLGAVFIWSLVASASEVPFSITIDFQKILSTNLSIVPTSLEVSAPILTGDIAVRDITAKTIGNNKIITVTGKVISTGGGNVESAVLFKPVKFNVIDSSTKTEKDGQLSFELYDPFYNGVPNQNFVHMNIYISYINLPCKPYYAGIQPQDKIPVTLNNAGLNVTTILELKKVSNNNI